MTPLCCIDGEIRSADNASIGIADIGLQRGYAVFDFVRTYNGRLFHLKDHLVRLHRSAAELHLKVPMSDAQITATASQMIKDSGHRTPALRLILTGGYEHTLPTFDHPNFIMIVEELPVCPGDVYTSGAKLITVAYQRELPHVKSINYLNSIRLEPFKRSQAAFDILYFSQHGVTECPRSSFFMFRGDTLVTPKHHVLAGITRKLVMRLAGNLFAIEERAVSLDELTSADEVFVTSTSKRLVPIVQIDEFEIGMGVVGERTKTVMQMFDAYTLAY